LASQFVQGELGRRSRHDSVNAGRSSSFVDKKK
jgi:hypothetical protein